MAQRRLLGISIHALCEEGDPCLYAYIFTDWNFYPRPLRGGRPSSKKEEKDHE